MKMIKFILLFLSGGLLLVSCKLDEEPFFLTNESAYENIANATAALDGVYNGLTQYNYYCNDFVYSTYVGSGFYVSGLGGSNSHPDNKNLASLKPKPSTKYTENPWKGMYKTIERANGIIANCQTYENPANAKELAWNDLVGEALFLRALTYYNLVGIWGEVPLRLSPTTVDDIHKPLSSTDKIYQQIIDDLKRAETLMYPVPLNRPGYPAAEAASMLLAKVYMVMATTDDAVPIQDPQQCWQLAYDHAKKVYGKYSLNPNYTDIFEDATADNTRESIFEIQFNTVVHSNLPRLFTASRAVRANTWGRIRVNAELVDLFRKTYPTDLTRYTATFKATYTKFLTGNIVKTYPDIDTSRVEKIHSFNNAFPYLYKYWLRDKNVGTPYTQNNFVVFRYADLLLMLAEISNELGLDAEKYDYVNEVLARVNISTNDFVPNSLTLGADYNGDKEAFRKAIMLEYRFELLGEGQDYMTNRRRGYQFFKETVIDLHNNWSKFLPKYDVTLSDDPNTCMHFPIPQSEVNTNNDIDN